MDNLHTPSNLLERLTQEARHVAHTITDEGTRFDELHFFALDIHQWLRQLSAEERNILQHTIVELMTQQSRPTLRPDDDAGVAKCLRLLLQMVYKQPQLL